MSPLQLVSAPSVVRHDGCVSVCLQPWRLRRSSVAQNPIICRRDLILQAEMKPVVGNVVSNKMQKSVVVAVDRLFHNKVYNRFVKRTSKFMAHGEADKCNISDMCFTWICEERLMNFVNAIVRRRTGELKGEMGDAKIHYGWRIHQL